MSLRLTTTSRGLLPIHLGTCVGCGVVWVGRGHQALGASLARPRQTELLLLLLLQCALLLSALLHAAPRPS
jgi:hypothetical protein